MKKILSLALAMLLVLGCMSFAAADESISGEIDFWCAYAENYGMGDIIAAFEAKYPNVKVNLTVANNSSDGNLLVDTAIMAGGQIDVQLAYGLDKTQVRVQSDFYTNLDEAVAEWGIDMKETFGVDVKFTGLDGEQHYYGIPVDALQWYIAINMTEWENAGLGELPTAWTWDEYIEACRKMTREGMYGGADINDGGYNWVNHVYQVYGADCLYNEEGMSAVLTNPLYREALEMKYQNENVDKIWYSFADARANGNTQCQPFLQSFAASITCCNIWRFIANTEQYPLDFKTGFAPYPTVEAGQTNYLSGSSVYGFLTITKDTDNFDAAWEFVKFFATEGNYCMAKTGHLGMYTDTDKDQVVEYVFGSLENAEKLIDVESFERVVLNYGGDSYVNTIYGLGGNEKLQSYELEILNGNMTIDDGLAELEAVTNQIIQERREELE